MAEKEIDEFFNLSVLASNEDLLNELTDELNSAEILGTVYSNPGGQVEHAAKGVPLTELANQVVNDQRVLSDIAKDYFLFVRENGSIFSRFKYGVATDVGVLDKAIEEADFGKIKSFLRPLKNYERFGKYAKNDDVCEESKNLYLAISKKALESYSKKIQEYPQMSEAEQRAFALHHKFPAHAKALSEDEKDKFVEYSMRAAEQTGMLHFEIKDDNGKSIIASPEMQETIKRQMREKLYTEIESADPSLSGYYRKTISNYEKHMYRVVSSAKKLGFDKQENLSDRLLKELTRSQQNKEEAKTEQTITEKTKEKQPVVDTGPEITDADVPPEYVGKHVPVYSEEAHAEPVYSDVTPQKVIGETVAVKEKKVTFQTPDNSSVKKPQDQSLAAKTTTTLSTNDNNAEATKAIKEKDLKNEQTKKEQQQQSAKKYLQAQKRQQRQVHSHNQKKNQMMSR